MWKILLSKRVLKGVKNKPDHIQQKFKAIFFKKAEVRNPFNQDEMGAKIEKLKATGDFYKIRIGDYRVGIYLDKKNKILKVATIFHRGKDYSNFP